MSDFNDSATAVQRVKLSDDDVLEVLSSSVKSLTGVQGVYETLRTNHLKRIVLYSEIESLIGGNPPYKKDTLKTAGVNIANFNTLEPMSLYEKACQVYWNLLFTSQSVIDINFRLPDEPEAKAVASKVSQHWNDVVRTMWRSFDINVATLTAQLVKLGVSPIIWPDERDLKWRVAELSKFFIPDQTSSDTDLLTMLFIETEVSIVYLIQVYETFKNKPDKSPWDIELLKKFLIFKANEAAKDTGGPVDNSDMASKLLSGDINFSKLYNESVKLISYFIRENDGDISHYMFNREFAGSNYCNRDGKHKGFLYAEVGQYKCLDECLLIFTQHPGAATIHSNKGLGHKLYSISQAKMMLDNSLVDMGRWASTPIIKSPQINTKDSQQIRVIHGQPTNIGSAELVQNNLASNLQAVVGVSNYLGGMLQRNIAHSGDDPGVPDSSTGSLTPLEIKFRALREFGILKNQVNHFYTTFDALLKQMVFKMLKSKRDYPSFDIVEEWKNRCIADGVPEELFKIPADAKELPGTWQVKATRTAGSGSQVAILLGLEGMLQIAGTFGTREAAAFKREWVKAVMGVEYVEEFTQDRDETDENGSGTSVAAIENFAFRFGEGGFVQFTEANDHRAHFSEHMKLAAQILEALTQQQFDIVEADNIITALLPHMREHWNVLIASPFNANYVKQQETNFAQLEKQATLIRANAIKATQAAAKEQQRQQEAQEEAMTDAERKDFIAQRDEARKDFKTKAQVDRAIEANQTRAEATQIKTDSDIENKRRKTEAEIEAIRSKKEISNTAREDMEADPAQLLNQINSGNTLSPYDIEDN